MMLSFLPAVASISFSSYLLFAAPIQMHHIITSFTGLMVTQFILNRLDSKAVEYRLAPLWFKKFRSWNYIAYMFVTTVLFGVFYRYREVLQRKNDPNRIQNIKSALELEDADFLKMVDELRIDYDENDLKEVERDVQSRVQRSGKKDLGI